MTVLVELAALVSLACAQVVICIFQVCDHEGFGSIGSFSEFGLRSGCYMYFPGL